MSLIVREYRCASCGAKQERIESRTAETESRSCECGGTAERIISAPKLGTVWGAAARQGPPEEPPPGAFTTRELAEGMSKSEWKAKRRKQEREQTHRMFPEFRKIIST